MKLCPDHWCGVRGIVKLRPSNLKQQAQIHRNKIQEFNIQKPPVNFPGIWQIFEFCPDCGEKLNIKYKP